MDDNQNSLLALADQYAEKFPNALPLRLMASKTDEEFDTALEDFLERAVAHLEANANHLSTRKEDSITCDLTAFLQIPDILSVTQQEHSNGHVDITIKAVCGPFHRLGEAKIYDGPSYHIDGLEQLVKRYSTGRETSGILVEYVKDAGIKDLVIKIKKYMDDNKPCSQNGEAQNHKIRWAFVTYHQHSSGETFRVLHLSCNLYRS